MHLKHIELSSFRNFTHEVIPFTKRVSLIVGRNGQGKTSILEAIYLLSHTKSFRSAKQKEVISWSSEKSKIKTQVNALVETDEGEKTISYEISDGRRKVFLNGNVVEKASHFYGQLPVLEFTPDELGLVKSAALTRRQFIDRVICLCDAHYVDHVVSYQRALKHRNATLKILKDPAIKPAERGALLMPWNQALVKYGKEICEKRKSFLKNLTPSFEKYLSKIADTKEDSKIILRYESTYLSEDGEVLNEERLLTELINSTERDMIMRATLKGVHRDDLGIYFSSSAGEKSCRTSASQGQARSIALALKLAAVDYVKERTKIAPIVLLDDVESELDANRTRALFRLINEFNTQVIITSTHPSEEFLKTVSTYQHIEIESGKVAKIMEMEGT